MLVGKLYLFIALVKTLKCMRIWISRKNMFLVRVMTLLQIRVDCLLRNQAGICATGEIRQKVKFAAFWCVFLTKIKVDTESW